MRQGTHHEAQKLTTSGRPRRVANEITWRDGDRLSKENEGAGFPVLPTSGSVLELVELDPVCQIASAARRTTATATATAIRRRELSSRAGALSESIFVTLRPLTPTSRQG